MEAEADVEADVEVEVEVEVEGTGGIVGLGGWFEAAAAAEGVDWDLGSSCASAGAQRYATHAGGLQG
jgi:hypothetical protein